MLDTGPSQSSTSRSASHPPTPNIPCSDDTLEDRSCLFVPDRPSSASPLLAPSSSLDPNNDFAVLLTPSTPPSHASLLSCTSNGVMLSSQPGLRHSHETQALTTMPTQEDSTDPIVSIQEACRLVRLERYHRRRTRLAQENLSRLQTAAARTVRLAAAAQSIRSTFAECIRLEDKISFANLLNAFHDASDACFFPDGQAYRDTEAAVAPLFERTPSFLGSLSAASETAIVEVLEKLRYDGTFLADRLVSLTQRELLALLPNHSTSRSNDSIFGGLSRTNSRTARPLGYVADAQMDLLGYHGFGSPLEALIHVPRSITKNDSSENALSLHVWAEVCGKLILQQKRGSERLVPAIVDIFGVLSPWPGKERLELWILETLQHGAFLLEQPAKLTFRARIEGGAENSIRDEARVECFFAQAVESLLALLADTKGASIFPPGSLDLIHAVGDVLQGTLFHADFAQWIAKRWLFNTWIMDLIVTPEVHGLLSDHYVSENARQRILLEVSRRCQRVVFDATATYTGKYNAATNLELTSQCHAVISRFSTIPLKAMAQHALHNQTDTQPCNQSGHCGFVAVSATDALTVIDAIYPRRRPGSASSDLESLRNGLRSSASSISGSSLFGSLRPLELSEPVAVWPEFQHAANVPTCGTPCSEERTSNESLLQDACIELEELAVNRPYAARHCWDVLVIRSRSTGLAPLADDLINLTQPKGDVAVTKIDDSSRQGSSSEMTRSHRLAREAIGSLIHHIAEDDRILSLQDERQSRDLQRLTESLFAQIIQEEEQKADFVSMHAWHRRLQDFTAYTSVGSGSRPISMLLTNVASLAQQSTQKLRNIETVCDGWISSLRPLTKLRSDMFHEIAEINERLRDKMWYIAEVRATAEFHDARAVATALRTMGNMKSSSKLHLDPPHRPWGSARTPSASLHLRSDAQILEVMSAKFDHGGVNKLSDEQARMTTTWMDRQGIERICAGEERLHRLCMEVRKCVDSITANRPLENSTSGTVSLFAREGATSRRMTSSTTQLSAAYNFASNNNARPHGLYNTRSLDTMSNASHTLSSMSSRDYLESRSPSLATRSSNYSIATTEARAPSSMTSIGTAHAHSVQGTAPIRKLDEHDQLHPNSMDRLWARFTSLLLSDLASNLFIDGSETDRSFGSGLGSTLVIKHRRTSTRMHRSFVTSDPQMLRHPRFDYETTFTIMLRKFSMVSNPATKLACLHDMDRLMIPYMTELSMPCGKTGLSDRNNAVTDAHGGQIADAVEPSVRGFRSIFSNATIRPTTIYRDMQYIASLVPSSTLQKTAAGKAFYNAAVAIISLKKEACRIMVETADSIIAYQSNNRGHEHMPSSAQRQRDSATFPTPSQTPPIDDVLNYGIQDAAHLLSICAKEGDPVAQRELATLYLTHSELMVPMIAPFALPREVFKEELEGKYRRNQDPTRCDPITMCVAHHWMSLSSKGGDSLAQKYLRQEMESF